MKYKILIGFWLIMGGAITASFAQTALKMPKKLTDSDQRVAIMGMLSNDEKMDSPWIVYSDRGDDFGEKFFVTEEKATQVHIYKASGSASNRKLTNPEDIGWRDKKDLFVYFGAEFTAESMIHKKCVILNSHDVVDKISEGEMSESEIPLYDSPDAKKSIRNVPLYYIYFVYKTDVDNKRFLLGKNYVCDVKSFKDQILGWVDISRVYEYNTRICFEPNYAEMAVAFRRCNPMYSAKVFDRSDQALNFQKGDTSYKPFWYEPTTFFFRNPEKGKKDLNLPFNGETLPDSLLSKLCSFPDNEKLKEAKILTGKSLPGYKFRFPYIETENRKNDDIFMLGVAGRIENKKMTAKVNCDDLKRNRRKLNIFFLIDNSIKRNLPYFALGQIQGGYTEFDKTYGVCFYPRTFMKHKITLGEVDPQNKSTNYNYTRDFISGYVADKSVIQGDNYLKALKNILENQNFETTKTNIIVIINNGKVANADFADIKDDVEAQLVAKNCFIIAFDYSRDNNFNNQIQQIMVSANSMFAEKSGFPDQKATFINENGVALMYSYLLAVMAQKNENDLGASQMDKLLGNASQKIISTVDNYINLQCSQTTQNNTGVKVNREDPFVRGQSALMAKNSKVQYIRCLEKGYSPMRYKLPPGLVGDFPVWKTDVLFTQDELTYISNALDGTINIQNNSDFSKKLYDLYVDLFNRFVGEDIPIEILRERTPQQIMSYIVGGTFGYDITQPIKRYTLGRILSNDQDMQSMFDSYKQVLKEKRNKIKRIISENDLIFCLDGDNCRSDQKQIGKAIYYYWIPIDDLP